MGWLKDAIGDVFKVVAFTAVLPHKTDPLHKLNEKVYKNYTGHYKRQQRRIDESSRKQEYIYQEQEKRKALAQRVEEVNRQRERSGVGHQKFRTDTRFKQPKETLG